MAMDRLNPEETMMEVGLLSTFNAIMQQSSDQIYDVSLADLVSGWKQNNTRKKCLLREKKHKDPLPGRELNLNGNTEKKWFISKYFPKLH